MSQLEVKSIDGVTVATITDSWLSDDDQIAAIVREIKLLGSDDSSAKILLNFADVNSMTTMMVGELLMVQKYFVDNDVSFRMCALRPHVVESLQISGLCDLFEIDENEQAGLAELKS